MDIGPENVAALYPKKDRKSVTTTLVLAFIVMASMGLGMAAYIEGGSFTECRAVAAMKPMLDEHEKSDDLVHAQMHADIAAAQAAQQADHATLDSHTQQMAYTQAVLNTQLQAILDIQRRDYERSGDVWHAPAMPSSPSVGPHR